MVRQLMLDALAKTIRTTIHVRSQKPSCRHMPCAPINAKQHKDFKDFKDCRDFEDVRYFMDFRDSTGFSDLRDVKDFTDFG